MSQPPSHSQQCWKGKWCVAAVLLLQGEGLGPDPGPSAVLGCWDTASGQMVLKPAPRPWPVSCGCISGGGRLVEGVRAWSACPLDLRRLTLTGHQKSL